jgi:hypothetical protein
MTNTETTAAPRNTEEQLVRPWIAVTDSLPPEREEVETKIHDAKGCRNETTLRRQGNLWFFPDWSMYVYYRPTHWRPNDK